MLPTGRHARPKKLKEIIRHILDIGACPSPVIETVGSENLIPKPKETVLRVLEPVLPEIGMLTFQSAGTASRTNTSKGSLKLEPVKSYISHIAGSFTGTIQLQGGITPQTIPEAISLGAEFLVCGTQLFRNPNKLTPTKIIDLILMEAYKQLTKTAASTRAMTSQKEHRRKITPSISTIPARGTNNHRSKPRGGG